MNSKLIFILILSVTLQSFLISCGYTIYRNDIDKIRSDNDYFVLYQISKEIMEKPSNLLNLNGLYPNFVNDLYFSQERYKSHIK